MTNSQLPPKQRQLSYLEDLAKKAGESFTYPPTRGKASAEITRLLARKSLSSAERHREAIEAWSREGERHGDAAAVREDEVAGWGSTATWS
jgi:hypothetical protein